MLIYSQIVLHLHLEKKWPSKVICSMVIILLIVCVINELAMINFICKKYFQTKTNTFYFEDNPKATFLKKCGLIKGLLFFDHSYNYDLIN